jgi:uncharacterized protein (TIGR02231 family)
MLVARFWLMPLMVAVCWVTVVSGVTVEDDASQTGKVTRVTLYRGQALVTRTVSVEGAAGSREVVVTGLPDSVQAESLYAESAGQLEIRAIRFRQRAVGEEPREEVRQLDEAIAATTTAIALANKQNELATQKSAFLDQLQGFVAPTALAELTKGVLNAETLRELTKFAFDERATIAAEQIRLAGELEKLNAQLALQQRQRGELTAGASRTVNEAVLFVEKSADGEIELELNYIVANCGWSPVYTVRGDSGSKEVSLEYNALVQQMSGEAWDGVQLTLSTASPALNSCGPSLAPFNVSLVGADQQMQVAAINLDGSQLALEFRAMRAAQQAGNSDLASKISFDEKTVSNYVVNRNSWFCQGVELNNPLSATSSLLAEDDVSEAPSLSYRLENPVSITSRSDQQMVRIHLGPLPGNFYHVATPLLSSYVYREAEILNASEHHFLAGPVTVYFDNRFVGRTEIPTVAQGETFVAGFGADPQLRARRELADRTEAVQGGNRELKLAYRIVVDNYKPSAVALRVLDRLPYTSRSGDIRIALGDSGISLSTDPVYLRRERPKNILRWDVDVPAGGAEAEPFEISYGYTLDYDRNFALADATNDPAAEQEFRELERLRLKK